MQCSEFDALLSQAIDGTLSGERLEAFEAHGRKCQLCGPMLFDAEAGRSWLKSLEDVEPPAALVNNILLATSGVALGKATARATWGERIGRWIDAVGYASYPTVGVRRHGSPPPLSTNIDGRHSWPRLASIHAPRGCGGRSG